MTERDFSSFLNASEGCDLLKFAEFLFSPVDIAASVKLWHPKVVQRSYGNERR